MKLVRPRLLLPVLLVPALLVPALLVLAASPFAQEPARPVDPADLERLHEVVDREQMHPGDGLVVVGVEQEENGFRGTTPALEKVERRERGIPSDALYQRRLALYEGASFQAPIRAETRHAVRPPAKGKALSEELEGAASKAWPIAVGSIVLVFLAARVFRG